MELRPVETADLAALRRAKVDALRVRAFTHEHERAVEAAQGYRLEEGSAETGYAIFLERGENGAARRLLEFDVEGPWRGRSAEWFESVVRSLEAQEVEVRSDDGAALEAALGFAMRHGWEVQPHTALYALETGVVRRSPRPETAEVRALGAGDLEEARAVVQIVREEGGETPDAESLSIAVEEDRLWGLFHDDRLAGLAEVLRLAWHRYADLHPVVRPECRKSGLATFLIGETSQALLTANHRLLTSAAAGDRAPRRIAEKIGLTLAAHRLLLRSR